MGGRLINGKLDLRLAPRSRDPLSALPGSIDLWCLDVTLGGIRLENPRRKVRLMLPNPVPSRWSKSLRCHSRTGKALPSSHENFERIGSIWIEVTVEA